MNITDLNIVFFLFKNHLIFTRDICQLSQAVQIVNNKLMKVISVRQASQVINDDIMIGLQYLGKKQEKHLHRLKRTPKLITQII